MFRKTVLISLVLVICVLATGCMGGQKDIKKDEEAAYTEMIAAACEEYGYEYDQQIVLPKGSALCYVLSDGDADLEIRVTINEESTYDYIGCEFEMERHIAAPDDNTEGLQQHLPVLVKIVGYFTDVITVADVAEYLNDDTLWVKGQSEEDPFMYKKDVGNLQHTIEEDGDEFEEYFFFSWDNGKKYSLRNK